MNLHEQVSEPPWLAGPGGRDVRSADGRRLALVLERAGTGGRDPLPCRANAALIACAPWLYDGLLRAIALLEGRDVAGRGRRPAPLELLKELRKGVEDAVRRTRGAGVVRARKGAHDDDDDGRDDDE